MYKQRGESIHQKNCSKNVNEAFMVMSFDMYQMFPRDGIIDIYIILNYKKYIYKKFI